MATLQQVILETFLRSHDTINSVKALKEGG